MPSDAEEDSEEKNDGDLSFVQLPLLLYSRPSTGGVKASPAAGARGAQREGVETEEGDWSRDDDEDGDDGEDGDE